MLNGALILNKPSGISSGVFSRKVKKLLNQKEKVGHAGTLDPLADGVLIVCIGEMTKFISYLTDETKTYVAEITIGIKTTIPAIKLFLIFEKIDFFILFFVITLRIA